jgi:hypothetical protein
MNTKLPSTPVSAHYYIDGIQRVPAVGTIEEARLFLRRVYDEAGLWAVALDIRVAADDLKGLSWKDAFDRLLSDRKDCFSWRIDHELPPKCVIAGYRAGERSVVRAFMTVIEALEFLPLSGNLPDRLQCAKLRVHLTAPNVVILDRMPSRAWDLALDLVLHGRVRNGHQRDKEIVIGMAEIL